MTSDWTQVSAPTTASHRCRQMIVRAEQKGKGVGRGGYPVDEEKSKQLKLVADKMDAFFAHSDEAAFDAVASPDITLHGDLLILDNDLSGADKVKQTLGTYTNAYDYKHENIAHGADIDGSSVFHFWLHQVGLQVWLLVGVVAQQSAALQVCLHIIHTMCDCPAEGCITACCLHDYAGKLPQKREEMP